jgi:2,3,4,5-tetrahydropyridine-2-carboxylate N-succinyltransferase
MRTMSDVESLKERIEALATERRELASSGKAKALLDEFLTRLESGEIRAAAPDPDGRWRAHAWVKQGILMCFKWGDLADFSISRAFQFHDKNTLPTQDFSARPEPPRIVPGGTSIRRGAYIGEQVVLLPPSYVNVGAYVDDGTMIDSHALVGSCAQVGKRVHLSAGAQLGGVLEPVGAVPVVIEDDVFVGALCAVVEGTRVARGAVLAAGVILTRGTPVYDLERERVLRATAETPLTIPEGAIVAPGARPARGAFAAAQGILLQAPVIIRYRKEGESSVVALEGTLR